MTGLISVLTCAKRGEYLAQTIASIDRAGGAGFDGRKVIHVDGPAEPIAALGFEGWDVESVSPEPRGARLAMLGVMSRAWRARVETLLYFEDDVLLCKNAIRAMLEIGIPEPLGFVSYCDLFWHPVQPLELVAFPGCPQTAAVPDGGFIGCQALAIPRRTLERIEMIARPPWLDPNNCDGMMGTVSECYGILDSLADHIGAQSAILGRRYKNLRVARGWRGEDFDADAVPRSFELNQIGARCSFHGGVLHPDQRPCAASGA